MARGDLSEEQWAVPEPLLPKGKKSGRPPMWSRRRLIDAYASGSAPVTPWRDVPERYGPWAGVRPVPPAGTWSGSSPNCRLDRRGGPNHLGSHVDSTIVRDHEHTAGARKGGCRSGRPASPPSPSTMVSDARAVA
ncbi:transposase [Streptomyces sp. NPDC058595]|uniref:transposase n=1 Tax=Streptomyces sp. NPDC058595 TaxID=3346550 RepID=UPI003653A5B6